MNLPKSTSNLNICDYFKLEDGNRTLFFDLDETLIHTTLNNSKNVRYSIF